MQQKPYTSDSDHTMYTGDTLETKIEKLVNFFSETKSNTEFNYNQYLIFDSETDRFYSHCEENNLDPKNKEIRKEYFRNEVPTWESLTVDYCISLFKL